MRPDQGSPHGYTPPAVAQAESAAPSPGAPDAVPAMGPLAVGVIEAAPAPLAGSVHDADSPLSPFGY